MLRELPTTTKWTQLVWGLVALSLGLAIGYLPLSWVVILLVGGGAIYLALSDPLWAVGFALLLGPTKPFTDVTYPQLPLDLGQVALILAFGVWLLYRIHKRAIIIPHTPLMWLIGGFTFIGLLSLVDTYSISAGLEEVIKWAQMLILIWIIFVELSERPHRRKLVMGLLLLTALSQALVGIWQFGLRGDGPEYFAILDDRFYRAYGTFEQPNPFGGFMAMMCALTLGICLATFSEWVTPLLKERHIKHAFNQRLAAFLGIGALLAVLGVALIMSWSRGSWLGFAVAVAVMLLAWPRQVWKGIALAGGGIGLFLTTLYLNLIPPSVQDRLIGFLADFTTLDVRGVHVTDANFSVLERVAHWQAAWEMARLNPFFGVGLGNYEIAYAEFSLINWPEALGHAHNIYLNTLAETGFVGICYYLAMWVIILWMTWRITRSHDVWIRSIAIGLLGVWVHLSAHSFLDKLYVANIHVHIGVMLGLLAVLWMEIYGERINN